MQTLVPTAVRLNNLSGSAADLDDSPDSPDGSWCTRLGFTAWFVYPSSGALTLAGQTVGVSNGDPFASAIWSAEASSLIARPAGTVHGEITPWSGSTTTDNPIIDMCPDISGVKCYGIETGPGETSGGFIYTVDPTTQISGSSVNPSKRSPYVFAFEARPTYPGLADTGLWQTDFFIERNGTDAEVMPIDHWGQHWIRLHKLTDNGTYTMHPWKWWYPCRDGHGSCANEAYIITGNNSSGMPDNFSVDMDTTGYAMRITGGLNACTFDTDVTYPEGLGSGDVRKMGSNNETYGVLAYDEWVLWKWHAYPTTTHGDGTRSYCYEAWWRRYGGAWQKVYDWRSPDVSPDPWDWRFTSTYATRGHNYLRLPTTVGDAGGGSSGDMMIYMADLIIAEDEADLPTYDDEP